MDGEPGYLVRYGLMGHVGRFLGPGGDRLALERGQAVVVQTDRGLELGHVLLGPDDDGSWQGRLDATAAVLRVLRPAGPDDWNRQRRCETLRVERFTVCRQVLDEAGWELELLDVEPLLDEETTVLHIIGSASLDLALLRAEFRSLAELDVVFEPVGQESGPGSHAEPAAVTAGEGRCGDCDCGEGGCGSATSRTVPADRVAGEGKDRLADSSGTSSHSACASCGIAQWMGSRRPPSH